MAVGSTKLNRNLSCQHRPVALLRLDIDYPADRVGQNNLASCYVQLREAPEALAAAKSAVQIVPKGVGPRLNLAFISAFAGDFAASETEARTALVISPTAAQGFLVLAEAQIGQGEIEKAALNGPASEDSSFRMSQFPILLSCLLARLMAWPISRRSSTSDMA